MDAYTGKWHEGDGLLQLGKRATEILHFAVYDPTSQYYGAPRYVPSATAIAGNRQSAIRNVSFFENDAVPRMALLVSGGRLTPDSMQQIEDFLRGKARGVDQAHRCMIIQVEPAKVGFQQQSKVAVELKPLTVGVTEDASFAQYRKDNDEEIREIFGMGQIFFTSEGANRANAQVAREITNEQEFEPDRLAKEYIINQTIVCDVLKHELLSRSDLNNDGIIDEFEMRRMVRQKIRVRFRFARMTLTDPMDSARMDQVYAQLGAITPNEMRASLGKPPYPKEYFFADKPLQIAMAELSAGLALAIALDPEAEPPKQEEGAPGAPGAEPKGLPGMPGMSGMPALGGDYADGIEVEGAEGLPDGDPRRPRVQVRPIHPGQGDRKPKVAPIRIPKHEGLRIASEMLADARKLGMIGASL
ncbi:MAG: phage portal protein, partial [Planctomycetota bacterium]